MYFNPRFNRNPKPISERIKFKITTVSKNIIKSTKKVIKNTKNNISFLEKNHTKIEKKNWINKYKKQYSEYPKNIHRRGSLNIHNIHTFKRRVKPLAIFISFRLGYRQY